MGHPTLCDVYQVELRLLGTKINPAPFSYVDFSGTITVEFECTVRETWLTSCLKENVVVVVFLSC